MSSIPCHPIAPRLASALAVSLALVSGCGRSAPPANGGGAAAADPLYLIANEIYAADSSTTYVNLVRSLDAPDLDPGKAIEFAGGRATVRAFNGWIFVAPPHSDVITRYAVAADGTLTKDGEVGFANYGFESVAIDEWGNTFISPTKAYLFNVSQGETVIWNPTTMEITGLVDNGGVELVREGWSIDGSPAVVRDGRLFRAVSWNDWDEYVWSKELHLAVYDVETDKLIGFHEETRCPALGNRIDRDEAGNLYFSNWIWNVGATLVNGAPESCVLRVKVGEETFDPSFRLAYTSLAEGRQGAMFAHLGKDRGLMSVFHHERATIDGTTVGSELVSTESWRLWTIDLAGQTAAPLEGLAWNTGAISTYHLDGRAFVLVPGADWGSTQVHEIEGGRAVHRFDLAGWSYQLFKVR